MNEIRLMGNLTRDPELSSTASGKTVCKFGLAVGREFEEGTDFFDCTAWGKTAETIAKYFNKGRRILLRGRVKIQNYEDSSGSKRRSWDVIVDKFYFCDSNRQQGVSEQEPADNYTESVKNKLPASSYDPNDVPF